MHHGLSRSSGGASPPQRILIVRLSAIGDIVFASPLIRVLRRAYPNAHLAWLVQPEYRALLDQHPDLDEVIVCPLGQWRRWWVERRFGALWQGIAALRATLRARRFDLALDLQGLLKSGILTWLSGARTRIGLGGREGSRWLMSRTIERGGERLRIGSEYRYLAEQMGWIDPARPAEQLGMDLYYSPLDADFAARTMAEQGLEEGYVVLCPFTTRPQKHWIEPRWAVLAGRLREEFGLVPVLLGGPGDQEAAARISAATDLEVGMLNLAGRTGLMEAAAVIDRATLLIGVDTGLGHMGIAFGTPSLLLFGATCPYLETSRANARVLYHRLACSPCKRRPTCDGDFTCMRRIDVEEIIAAARALIGRAP
ncbi:lipopolysaccharide heptosyltransferase [Thiocapsa imhoffii]|uniref:Lipopolysaccharide heptosyltransferase n=1 Tax=Thiocapsa imhoffii TaxID=382777 RepID=A0A9X0WER2_9GAMM|nr:glycosyltransferase family 9 protein [Thiocapsa imhoffii]MBK1643185.1 lipopolysaccharide heptosyltransferase [Thiocapsa imhoffii]